MNAVTIEQPQFDTQTEGYSIKPVEPERFNSFGIHALRHNYHEHPMFQLDSIEQLAQYLLKFNKCRFLAHDLKLDSDFYHQSEHAQGMTIRQVFENINAPKSWIALYNIENHPEYRKLLNNIVDELRPLIEPEQQRIIDVQGFMFISAPPAITPFHIDRENNFWIQLKGQKKMSVFDSGDRSIIPGKVVENFILHRGLRGVHLTDEIAPKAHQFNTKPGDGVYFPSTSPHMTETTDEWVTPTDGVSVSLGIVFYTDFTRQQALQHHCNHLLRKLGLNPAPVPTRPPLNNLKSMTGAAYARLRRKLLNYKPPPGAI